MRNRRTIVLVLVGLALLGGGAAAIVSLTQGGSGGSGAPRYAYPKTAEEQLTAACTARRTRSACLCSLRALENNVPYTIYQDIIAGGVRANTQGLWQAYQRQSANCLRS